MSHSELETRSGIPRVDSRTPIMDVLATLQGLLPAGTAVALAWQDITLGQGSCCFPAAADALRGQAGQALREGLSDAALAAGAFEWEHENGARLVLLLEVGSALAPAPSAAWQGAAQVQIGCALESMSQRLQIEELQRSKQLQKALFEIADLAGADLAMPEMLSYFHRILCSLMYAENCYIVECDEQQGSLEFL